MSNLLISYPAIPYDARERETLVGTFADDRPVGNIISSERYQYGTITTIADGDADQSFDLGVGESQAVDHIILANAKKLIDQGVTEIYLNSSSDASSYSNVWANATFNSATLYGSGARDYIAHSLSLTTNRAWSFSFTGGTLGTRDICKLYFGNAWDAGKDCDFNFKLEDISNFKVNLLDGSSALVNLTSPRYRVSLVWNGVSDAQTLIFRNRIAKYWDIHKFFLYTTAEHRILNDLRLLHVRCLETPQITRTVVLEGGSWIGRNSISVNFQEVKG